MPTSTLIVFSIIIFIIGIGFTIWQAIETKKRRERLKKALNRLVNGASEISPKQFMNLRKAKVRGGKYEPYLSSSYNFAGVYIIHNYTKDKFYVGQSKTVFNRVNNHFTGKGNGDVYVDYRNGDIFTVKMIPLRNSGFRDLDSLERHFIKYYDAFENGYNKTRGNR